MELRETGNVFQLAPLRPDNKQMWIAPKPLGN